MVGPPPFASVRSAGQREAGEEGGISGEMRPNPGSFSFLIGMAGTGWRAFVRDVRHASVHLKRLERTIKSGIFASDVGDFLGNG